MLFSDPAPPLSSLRFLIPPVRLISACMWQIAKEQHLEHYEHLENFVTLVTKIVPDILSQRQRTTLIMGLRAKVLLEMCRGDLPVDSQTVKNHLHQIQSSDLIKSRHSEMDNFQSNLLNLILQLLEDPAKREDFFQRVYPVEYGPDFDKALQVLVCYLISRLDQLLPVPNFKQVASWVNSSCLWDECKQYTCQTEDLQRLLQHNCHRPLDNNGLPSVVEDRIITALSRSPTADSQCSQSIFQREPCVDVWRSSYEMHQDNQQAQGLHQYSQGVNTTSDASKEEQEQSDYQIDVNHEDDDVETECELTEYEGRENDATDDSGVSSRPLKFDMSRGTMQTASPESCDLEGIAVEKLKIPDTSGQNYKSFRGVLMDPPTMPLSDFHLMFPVSKSDQNVQKIQAGTHPGERIELNAILTLPSQESPQQTTLLVVPGTSSNSQDNNGTVKEDPSQDVANTQVASHSTGKVCSSVGQTKTLVSQQGQKKCPHCSRCFTYYSDLLRHQRCHQRLQFRMKSREASVLAVHKLKQLKAPTYTCPTCGRTLGSLISLRQHQKMHERMPLKCSSCGRNFERMSGLMSHMQTHLNQVGPSPPSSSQDTPTETEAAVAQINRSQCRFCGMNFPTMIELHNHLMTHTELKPYHCNYCGQQSSYEMERQYIAKEEPGLHLSVLRLLSSPLRLICATIWRVVQEADVLSYGILEEFLTLIAETVPDLLDQRQWAQLILGLRAKVILELCRCESSTDTETIQHHLDRIRLPAESSVRDADVEASQSNFLALVDILLSDSVEREIFFQEVFPVEYGPKYDLALQRLISIFVSRLEEFLPIPRIDKLASMLGVAPSVMEECFQTLSHPQELLKSLSDLKNYSDVETKASSPPQHPEEDDYIFSCLSHPPLVQVVMDTEHKACEVEFESSCCEDVLVECEGISTLATGVDTEDVKPEKEIREELVKTADYQHGGVYGHSDIHQKQVCGDTKDDLSEEVVTPAEGTKEPLRSKFIREDGVVVNAEGLAVEDRVERLETTGHGERLLSAERQPEEQASKSVHSSCQTVSDNFKNSICHQRQLAVKLERIDITDKPLPPPLTRQSGRVRKKRVRLLWRKNKGPEITWIVPDDEPEPTPKPQHSVTTLKTDKLGCKPPAVVFACSKCSFHDGSEATLHQHLMKNHPDEFSRLLSAGFHQRSVSELQGNRTACASARKVQLPKRGAVSKKCPVCAKTFTRSADMRRHLKGHLTEQLPFCSGCGRCFQHIEDLRRHTVICQEIISPQPNPDPLSQDGKEPETISHTDKSIRVLDSSNEDCTNPPQVGQASTSTTEQTGSETVDPRVCPVCSLVLARASDMERHMKSHSAEKPNECFHCSKTYRYPYNLKKHMDMCHKALNSPVNESADHPHDSSQEQKAVKLGFTQVRRGRAYCSNEFVLGEESKPILTDVCMFTFCEMEPQYIAKEGPDPHLSVLRLLMSPLRLICATIWRVVQERDVLNYGILEEFITSIAETIPDLLHPRQWSQLIFGLRAKVILELCRSKSSTNTKTIQHHLDRIRLPAESSIRDADVEASWSNFLAFVKILLSDPVERDIFFQEVFPVDYGPKYDLALQRLISIFVSRLEEFLPISCIDKVAAMLSLAPTVREECFQTLSHPQELLTSLSHLKNHSGIETKCEDHNYASSPPQPPEEEDCIISCLSHPSIVQVALNTEHKACEVEFGSSYCEDVSVECEEVSDLATEVNTVIREDAMMVNADEVSVGNRLEGVGERLPSAETHPEEQLKSVHLLHQTASVHGSGGNLIKSIWQPRQLTVRLERIDITGKPLPPPFTRQSGSVQNKRLQLVLTKSNGAAITWIVPDDESDQTSESQHPVTIPKTGTIGCKPPPVVFACSKCPFQDGSGVNLDQHLMKNHPDDFSRLHSAKTFTRGADIRRKLKGHLTNRLHFCSGCGRCFQEIDDLKRHTAVCEEITPPQPNQDPLPGEDNNPKTTSHNDKRTRELDSSNEDCKSLTQVGEASTDHTASETVDPRVCSVPSRSLPCPLDMERHMGSHSTEKTQEELYLPEKKTDKQSRDTFQNQMPIKLGVDTNLKRDDVHSKVCPTCGKTFTRPYDMRRHQKRHSQPFSMQTHLKHHIDLRFESLKGSEASTDHTASETVDPRVCSVSCQILPCPLDMERHTGSHSTEKTHEELYLPEKESDKQSRDTFQDQKPVKLGLDTNLTRDDVQSKVCPTCGKTFTRAVDMRRHQKRHIRNVNGLLSEFSHLTRDDLRSKVCPICGKTFTRASSMRAHLKCHTDLRFKSSNGSETFPHSSDLEKQKQDSCTEPTEEKQAVVSPEEPLVCDTCGKKFFFLTHYKWHVSAHRQASKPTKRWHKCDKCEEIFRTVPDLNKHQRCHWGDDTLQCAHCGRRFKHSIRLASHRQIHSQCTMCDGKFTDITSICLHYLEVHNIKGPYSCSHCHQTFTKVCSLVLHLSKHTGEQPYQCPQCPKRFMTAPGLTTHKRTHRDGSSVPRERSHLCHVCGPDPHLSVLRLLMSPLRLICATVWRVVQERDVLNYGILEEFITSIAETIPDLLHPRQWAQLIFGLRAKVILELCRSKSSTNTKTIQHHLDRIRLPAESSIRDADVEASWSNFLAFVKILLSDPVERDIFFQEVFPVDYGPKYDLALQRLISIFVSRLEEFLPISCIDKVAAMLSLAPTVREECFQTLSHPQELLTSLSHLKNHSDNETKCEDHNYASSPPQPPEEEDCIISCLSHPSIVQVAMNTEHKACEVEFGSSYCEDVSVECEEVSDLATEVNTVIREDAMMVNADEVSEGVGERLPSAETHPEEQLKSVHLLHQTASVHGSGGNFIKSIWQPRQLTVRLERIDITGKPLPPPFTRQRGSVQNKRLQLVLTKSNGAAITWIVPDDESDQTSESQHPVTIPKTGTIGCKPPPVVFACSKCPFQDGSGVNLDQHLMKNHPDDFSRLHSAKTFTRGADIRRKLKGHLTNRLHFCAGCGRCFQEIDDLKRHTAVCEEITPPQPNQHPLPGEDNKPKTTSHNDKRTRELDSSNEDCKSLTQVGEASTDHTASETVDPRVCSVPSRSLPCPLDMERHMGSHSTEKTQEELYLPEKETDKQSRDTFQNQKPIKLGVDTNLKRDDVHSKVCPTCGKTFTRPYDMRRHQKRHSRPFSMQTHLKHHIDLRFESLKGSEASTDHTASETVDPRVCSVSSQILPCPLDMERHMGSHSTEKTHEELYLPEKESDKQSRDTFQDQKPVKLGLDTNLTRDDVQSKVCPTCGKTFTRAVDMRRHQKRHIRNVNGLLSEFSHLTRDDLRSKVCPICGKTFTRASSMRAHLKCHTDLCFKSSNGSETFPHSSDLEKQKQDSCTEPTEEKQAVVSPEEPLVCDTCGKKFFFLTHYKWHVSAHRQASKPTKRWHKCDKCEEIFRTVPDLNKHQRCHWGDDPLQCAHCGRRFKHSIRLASHRQIHSQCTMCDGKFTDITSICHPGSCEMEPQYIAKEGPDPHLSVLRLLMSPLRLICATVWRVVQERDVLNYGILEEFITSIAETIPDLLHPRQWAQLIFGLRAKVILELCRCENSTDTETIQHHLDRIRRPAESSIRDADVEASWSNFLAFVKILLSDPVERDIFFQEVFPVEYGPKYDYALQRLISIFVSRLEEFLPISCIDKVAAMLSLAPTVREECFQTLSHPQELLTSLSHLKNHSDNETKCEDHNYASSPPQPPEEEDCIISCLSHPSIVQVAMNTEHKACEVEFGSSYCEDVSVECEEVSDLATEVNTVIREDAMMVNADGVSVENRLEGVGERLPSAETHPEEQLKSVHLLHQTASVHGSGGNLIKSIWQPRQLTVRLERIDITGKPLPPPLTRQSARVQKKRLRLLLTKSNGAAITWIVPDDESDQTPESQHPVRIPKTGTIGNLFFI
ncbi:hypothetical protein ACEWY4_002111 [Coilia grayii]|uniref:C2H2-type domain-containing protein n=1 Tax=Coilia grayii TaxID=363190 RepID=A0ABD1KUV3_9TELE